MQLTGQLVKLKNMVNNRILIFGYGYCAKALIKKFQNKKSKILVVSRNSQNIDKLNSQGIKSCYWSREDDVKNFINKSNTILITAPPNNFVDPVASKYSKYFALTGNKIRLIYLSSTSVYGDHKGAWVNENSKLKANSELGKWRLKVETDWLSFAKSNSLSISVLRLSGIYGLGRSAFDRISSKSFKIVKSPNILFSRIHIDDIAIIIQKFIDNENLKGVYNLSDNMPATSEAIYLEAFRLLKLDPPTSKNLDELNLSKTAMGFFSESKKVCNKKLLNNLNYKLIHPDYFSGMKDIFKKLKKKFR